MFSPDGIHEQDGEIVGGIEVKCPNSKTHVEYIRKGVVPKKYAAQVRAPFILSDQVKWWYFCSFDDRNYERPLFLVKVCREDLEGIEQDRIALAEYLKLVDDEHATLTF
jgi:hypothetical protein